MQQTACRTPPPCSSHRSRCSHAPGESEGVVMIPVHTLSATQETRARSARAREARQRLAEIREAREAKAELRQLEALAPLVTAFSDLLSREVGVVATSWVVDRLAELAIAAAKQADLPTLRAVLGDFMRHARAI